MGLYTYFAHALAPLEAKVINARCLSSMGKFRILPISDSSLFRVSGAYLTGENSFQHKATVHCKEHHKMKHNIKQMLGTSRISHSTKAKGILPPIKSTYVSEYYRFSGTNAIWGMLEL